VRYYVILVKMRKCAQLRRDAASYRRSVGAGFKKRRSVIRDSNAELRKPPI
jgi:hypothetical protein